LLVKVEGKNMKKLLYTDKNTEEDIEKLSETDSDSVIYNLYEDILVLKEELAHTEKQLASARGGLEIEKQNERVAEYHRQWAIEEAIEGKY